LALALQAEGLRVWYDEFELRVGVSLRRSIDTGLANSRFGVVVLSEPFFRKGWTNYELDGLVTREMSQGSGQLILPLWHRVTKDEVVRYSPSLADKLALRTSDSTVEEIASEIAAVVREGSGEYRFTLREPRNRLSTHSGFSVFPGTLCQGSVAMQKVEGSSPFIRFTRKARSGGPFGFLQAAG